MIEYIQSIILLISAFMIIVSAIGLFSLNNKMKNVVYARILVVGVFDIAVILVFIALEMYLFAGIYIILAPFTAHAIGRSYFVESNEVIEDNLENPNAHPIKELRQSKLSKKDFEDRISISAIDINEDV